MEGDMPRRIIPCAILIFLLNACAKPWAVATIDVEYKPVATAKLLPYGRWHGIPA